MFGRLRFRLMLCVAGCGHSDGLVQIGGGVTYDGQPVKSGTISFLPPDGNGPTAAAIIADGKYSVKVAPGKKQVQDRGFQGRRPTTLCPERSHQPDGRHPEQILPERYNAKSKLACEITAGTHVYDFTLSR